MPSNRQRTGGFILIPVGAALILIGLLVGLTTKGGEFCGTPFHPANSTNIFDESFCDAAHLGAWAGFAWTAIVLGGVAALVGILLLIAASTSGGPSATPQASAAVVRSAAGERAPAADGHESDIASQLAKLASLKDAGALTEDEFDAAKNRLLGQ